MPRTLEGREPRVQSRRPLTNGQSIGAEQATDTNHVGRVAIAFRIGLCDGGSLVGICPACRTTNEDVPVCVPRRPATFARWRFSLGHPKRAAPNLLTASEDTPGRRSTDHISHKVVAVYGVPTCTPLRQTSNWVADSVSVPIYKSASSTTGVAISSSWSLGMLRRHGEPGCRSCRPRGRDRLPAGRPIGWSRVRVVRPGVDPVG